MVSALIVTSLRLAGIARQVTEKNAFFLAVGLLATCGAASSWRRSSEIHAYAPRALCPGYY